VAGKISGTSPMSLVENCVRCGTYAAHGRRIDATRYFYPLWVWLGLLAGLIPLIVLCAVGRKTLHISFSLCPECARAQRNRRWIAAGAWGLVLLSIVASVGLNEAWILVGTGILFLGAVAASFLANAPLQVVGYKDQVFTVKGFGKKFLELRGMPTV
jgi:hypothetical protein